MRNVLIVVIAVLLISCDPVLVKQIEELESLRDSLKTELSQCGKDSIVYKVDTLYLTEIDTLYLGDEELIDSLKSKIQFEINKNYELDAKLYDIQEKLNISNANYQACEDALLDCGGGTVNDTVIVIVNDTNTVTETIYETIFDTTEIEICLDTVAVYDTINGGGVAGLPYPGLESVTGDWYYVNTGANVEDSLLRNANYIVVPALVDDKETELYVMTGEQLNNRIEWTNRIPFYNELSPLETMWLVSDSQFKFSIKVEGNYKHFYYVRDSLYQHQTEELFKDFWNKF